MEISMKVNFTKGNATEVVFTTTSLKEDTKVIGSMVDTMVMGLKAGLEEVDTKLWLRIPLVKSDRDSIDATSEDLNDSWELWNSFRLLCEHDSKLSVALDVMSTLPSETSLGRWMGESVRAAIISTDSFLTNARGYPCLSKRHQKLLAGSCCPGCSFWKACS